jgi:hypothetical protein
MGGGATPCHMRLSQEQRFASTRVWLSLDAAVDSWCCFVLFGNSFKL